MYNYFAAIIIIIACIIAIAGALACDRPTNQITIETINYGIYVPCMPITGKPGKVSKALLAEIIEQRSGYHIKLRHQLETYYSKTTQYLYDNFAEYATTERSKNEKTNTSIKSNRIR
jgi:hypothetical protein